MTDRSLLDNLDRVDDELLDAGSIGLLSDADGTLSEISERPEEAEVSTEIADLLGRLNEICRLVAIISGRRAADAASLVGREDLLYIGNHGLERLEHGRLSTEGEAAPDVAAAKAAILSSLPSAEGLLVEDKHSVIAIHFRLCGDDEAILAVKRLAERVAADNGLRTQSGRCVIEVRPEGANKGDTIIQLAKEYELRQVIYLGDDYTDMDAFQALRTERAGGGLSSISIGVATDESPPGLKEAADYWVSSVGEVREFLEWFLIRALRR